MEGQVARCRKGKLGIITRVDKNARVRKRVPTKRFVSPSQVKTLEFERITMYYGRGFDGKPWQSRDPVIVANSITDYIKRYINHDWNDLAQECETVS